MNAYRTIWLQPKRTFEQVANKTEQPLIALSIIILGLVFALDTYPEVNALLGEGDNKWSLLFVIPMGIGVTFLILGLVMPGLIKLFGQIWKGSSTMRQMVNICAISFIPFSLILIYQLALFSFGIDPTLERVNAGISYLLWLWSFCLLIIGVAKVQRFSYGMALLNILISYLPLLIIGLLRN